MTDRKLLYVSLFQPCPPEMGVHHRVLNIARRLKSAAQVTFLWLADENDTRPPEPLKDEFEHVEVLHTRSLHKDNAWNRLRFAAAFHLPGGVVRRLIPRYREQFNSLLAEHDLVWFHTLSAADAVGFHGGRASVVDIDDFNSEKYALAASTSDSLKMKLAFKLLSWKWRIRESRILTRFSLAAVCSSADAARLPDASRVHIIPNGFAAPMSPPVFERELLPRIGFIGNMEYGPNRDGIKWFVEKCWPGIRESCPQAVLRIAGRGAESIGQMNLENIEVQGFIPDASAEIRTWTAMVVPLFYGGGTRLKIIEAFSLGCPVVSTAVGAAGLDTVSGTHLLIADTPDAVTQACLELLREPQKGTALSRNAWTLFSQSYDWNTIGHEIRKTAEHGFEIATRVNENG